ncbi:MAG: amidoligase family protein [Bacilli bacterium]
MKQFILNLYYQIYKYDLTKLSNSKIFMIFISKNIDLIDDKLIDILNSDLLSIYSLICMTRNDEDKLKLLSMVKIKNIIFTKDDYFNIKFKNKDYYQIYFNKLNKKEQNLYLTKFIKDEDIIYNLIINNLNTFSKMDIINIIVSNKLSDETKEKIINKLDNENIIFILSKINNPNIKCKYFNKLSFEDKINVIKFLTQDKLIEYIDDVKLKPYVIANLKDETKVINYYISLNKIDKIIALSQINNEKLLYNLINLSKFDDKTYLSVLKDNLDKFNDSIIIKKLFRKININVIKDILQSNEKFNIPYENIYMFNDIDPNITFGVELECVNEYNDILIKIKHFLNDWDLKKEASVSSGVEFTSPVLCYNKKCLNELKYVCDFLEKNDFFYSKESGGHIHIGFSTFKNVNELKMFYKIYLNIEKLLYILLNRPNSIVRNNIQTYAIPISKRLNDSIIDFHYPKFKTMEELICFIFHSSYGKYSSLNINNVYDGLKNTLEIRIPNIEFNFNYLHENIAFLLKLISVSKNISYENKYSNNNILVNKLIYSDSIEEKKNILLYLLFNDNEYLYNVFNFRFERNIKVNKDLSYIDDKTSSFTF